MDFISIVWPRECISMVSENAFTERYQKWCKRMGYNFSRTKAANIYIKSLSHIVTLPKNSSTKLLSQTAAKELTAMNELVAIVRGEMTRLAKELPEYETVHAMYGMGNTTAAQLIAEIGDIRNFPRGSSLIGFAGVDPAAADSGKNVGNSKPATKRGSPQLRKTLFQIMTTYLRLTPQDEPVYQFLDQKRSEGKPYYVYMTSRYEQVPAHPLRPCEGMRGRSGYACREQRNRQIICFWHLSADEPCCSPVALLYLFYSSPD